MLRAAAGAAAAPAAGAAMLAVTVLTSLDAGELARARPAGHRRRARARLGRLAHAGGLRGDRLLAAGARPAARRRGPAFRLVTPGIRPAGAAAGDQKRVATPAAALAAGADLLVIGRPLTQAPDAEAALAALAAEIGGG